METSFGRPRRHRRASLPHWFMSTQAPQEGEEEDRQGAFFFSSIALPWTAARAPVSSAPVSSAPSPQARAMIEYHKCRVSSFSNWARYLCRNRIFTGRDLPRTRTGQGGLSGEAQARGRGRRVDGADPAHRARGVAARPLVLSRQRGAARYAYAAGPRRAAVGPQSLPRQRLFDA